MQAIIDRLSRCQRVTRIVATGSSNTARTPNIGNHQNWVDFMDNGLAAYYGRFHITINSGISGQTSRQVLARFDTDVELFQPHIVLITCGGNDSNPDNENPVPLDEYTRNLAEMADRCLNMSDCIPILQTYYSPDYDRLKDDGHGAWGAAFPAYMAAVLDVAREKDVFCIDHHSRWDRLRRQDLKLYRSLMDDAFHMQAPGHVVVALDVMRHFGAKPVKKIREQSQDALAIQKLMDQLEP